MSELRELAERVHRGGGYLFWLFLVLVGFAVGGFVVGLVTSHPREPWGKYRGVAVTGEINGNVVTRQVDDEGHPIVDELRPTFHVYRCGPPELIRVVSARYYLIGDRQDIELRVVGPTEPFEFPTINSADGCGIVTFRSTPIPPLEYVQDGTPFQIRLDIQEVTGRYLTVSVDTEQLVWGIPEQGTPDTVEIEIG